jgi:hypothetical protein
MPTEILHATAQSLRRTADLVTDPLALDSFDTAAKTIRQAAIDAAKLVARAVVDGGLPFLREEGNTWPIKSLLEERPTPFNSAERDERWSMVWEMLPDYIRRYVPAGVVAHTRGLEGWKNLSVFSGGTVAVAEQPKTLSELRRRAAVEAQLMRTVADLIGRAEGTSIRKPLGKNVAAGDGGANQLNTAEQAIVDVLRKHRKRLTTEPLLKKALGVVNSNGKTTLSSLVKRRVLNNSKDERPRGYGLPEFSENGQDHGQD